MNDSTRCTNVDVWGQRCGRERHDDHDCVFPIAPDAPAPIPAAPAPDTRKWNGCPGHNDYHADCPRCREKHGQPPLAAPAPEATREADAQNATERVAEARRGFCNCKYNRPEDRPCRRCRALIYLADLVAAQAREIETLHERIELLSAALCDEEMRKQIIAEQDAQIETLRADKARLESEIFAARVAHTEFGNRIALALGLKPQDEISFDALVESVAALAARAPEPQP